MIIIITSLFFCITWIFKQSHPVCYHDSDVGSHHIASQVHLYNLPQQKRRKKQALYLDQACALRF